jgi:hypothetical protein
MKRSARLFVCLLLLSLIYNPTKAQDSLNVKMLGEVHDFVEEAYDVAISGDYIYLSSGLNSGLRILDMSNPAALREAGYVINTDPCPEVWSWMTDRICVSGNHAYVLYFDGTWSFAHYRLYIYNVSDPSAPFPIGYTSLPDNCTSMFVEGDYVYITSFKDVGQSEVMVIDVSDPANPFETGSFATPGMANDVYVTGNKAYVADNNALVIYDVSNPGSASKVGSYSPVGGMALIHNAAVLGDYVIITDAVFGIRILDASDGSQINEVSSLPHGQNDVIYSPLKVSGDKIYYIQNGDISGNKLVALDISNPEAPVERGTHNMQGTWWFYGFDYNNGYASIAAGKEGLKMLKISSPDSITDAGIYDPYDLTSGLAVAGNYAFVGTYMNDLVVYDVSDPSSPLEIASLIFPGSPIKQISVWGSHLYVPGVVRDENNGVSVLDITNPADPEEIAYWPEPEGDSGPPFSVERYGNYAFLACALGGVEVYDVSQIDQPAFIDNWTLWNAATNQGFGVTNVKIAWPYLYAPDRAFGLYVLDISNPSNIKEVASIKTPGEAMWADISEDHRYIYIADGNEGLMIIDVSNPLEPVETGCYKQNLEMANHADVSGDYVYISDGGQTGLHVIDVSDPAMPVEVAYHKTQGAFAHDVVVDDGLIYFLDYTHFEIFELTRDPSGAEDNKPASVVSDYRIVSVYPNPFNSMANIVFDLPETSHVKLEIYNTIGQKVKTIAEDFYQAKRNTLNFQAGNMTSGIYILQLEANGTVDSRKLVLVK